MRKKSAKSARERRSEFGGWGFCPQLFVLVGGF